MRKTNTFKYLPVKIGCLAAFLIVLVFPVVGQNIQKHEFSYQFSVCSVAEYTEIIESNPSDAMAYFNRGNRYQIQNKLVESISDFSRVIQLDSQFSSAYSKRGLSYNLIKEYDLAIADFTMSLARKPYKDSDYAGRGYAYCSKKEVDKGIEEYWKAIEIAPEEWIYRYVRGWLYYNEGKKILAEADFKEAKVLETVGDNLETVTRIKTSYPQFP